MGFRPFCTDCLICYVCVLLNSAQKEINKHNVTDALAFDFASMVILFKTLKLVCKLNSNKEMRNQSRPIAALFNLIMTLAVKSFTHRKCWISAVSIVNHYSKETCTTFCLYLVFLAGNLTDWMRFWTWVRRVHFTDITLNPFHLRVAKRRSCLVKLHVTWCPLKNKS